MSDAAFTRLMVKIAWGHAIVFLLVAIAATWLYGLAPEIVLVWTVLALLLPLMLLTAYGVRQAFLGVGALFVASVLLAAAFLHRNTWSVEQSQLLEWTIGAAALAVWLFAWDARKQRSYPAVGHAAGLLALAALLAYAVLAAVYGSPAVTNVKGILGLAVVVALYDLAEERWKVPVSIAALIAGVVLVATLVAEGRT